MRLATIAWLVASTCMASTGYAAEPDEALTKEDLRRDGRFRVRAALGANMDMLYDTPIYAGGVEIGLGSRVHPEWLVYALARYQVGQTEHGLWVHEQAFGAAFSYTPGWLRLGLEAEGSFTALRPYTHSPSSFPIDGVYQGLGVGAKVSLGAELVQVEDGALFLEYRSGVRYAGLISQASFTPGSLWLGGRWGR